MISDIFDMDSTNTYGDIRTLINTYFTNINSINISNEVKKILNMQF